jgi:hypothetical protein
MDHRGRVALPSNPRGLCSHGRGRGGGCAAGHYIGRFALGESGHRSTGRARERATNLHIRQVSLYGPARAYVGALYIALEGYFLRPDHQILCLQRCCPRVAALSSAPPSWAGTVVMTLNEWLTLFALVFGPVLAVLITLRSEERRSVARRRYDILRTLLSTRHTPIAPQFSMAINLIPVEFYGNKQVQAEARRFHELANQNAGATELEQRNHQQRMTVQAARLIHQIAKACGLDIPESDIQTDAYIADALASREMLNVHALNALPAIAATLQVQADQTRVLYEAVTASLRARQ